MQRLAWAFKIHLYLCGHVDQALLLEIDQVSLWVLKRFFFISQMAEEELSAPRLAWQNGAPHDKLQMYK